MNRTKKQAKIIIFAAVLVAILLVLVSVLIVLEVRNSNELPDNTESTSNTHHIDTDSTETGSVLPPWEQPGAKQPKDYTWEEFLALPAELQIAFQFAFDSSITFEEWMNRVQSTEPEQPEHPWEHPGAKLPNDYTWEEFLALSAGQQHAFQFAFGSVDAFDAWLNRVQPTEPEQIGHPWEQSGAKQPQDYTWAEFEALTAAQQMAFQNHLGPEAFETWLNNALEQAQTEHPWEQPGAKQPQDYTWEEFLALSPELQIVFQHAFGSSDAFEDWMNRAQSAEPEQSGYPWDQPGAKQPKDYTWDEFLALPAELQIAFQFAFDSSMSFEEWMNQKMPKP